MQSIRNQQDVEVWREIEAASDRVLAIVSATFIEERLADAIKNRLLRDPNQLKKFFAPSGALGTYEAKVALGYLLSIYVNETRRNLIAVGQIRNRFAHRTRVAAFEHKELEPFFKDITLPDRIGSDLPADSWRNVVVRYIVPLKKGAPKRQRFLTTAQMLLAYLQPQIYEDAMPIDPPPPF
jgi:hypothetical protein